MGDITLYDLFKDSLKPTLNVAFYNLQKKETMDFNHLNTSIDDIVKVLKKDSIPLHSVIACLVRPSVVLPALILG